MFLNFKKQFWTRFKTLVVNITNISSTNNIISTAIMIMHTLNASYRRASCWKWYCIILPLETTAFPLLRRSGWGSCVRLDCSHSRGRCTCKIKSRIAMTKQQSTRNLFTSKLDSILRKKLLRYYILSLWSILLFGVQTLTLQKGKKYLNL